MATALNVGRGGKRHKPATRDAEDISSSSSQWFADQIKVVKDARERFQQASILAQKAENNFLWESNGKEVLLEAHSEFHQSAGVFQGFDVSQWFAPKIKAVEDARESFQQEKILIQKAEDNFRRASSENKVMEGGIRRLYLAVNLESFYLARPNELRTIA